MIHVVYGADRVTVRGHAGFAPRGSDIVCAAASALVYAFVGALEAKNCLREVTVKPGLVSVAAREGCGAEFAMLRCGLSQLAGKYPKCVRIEN